MMRSLLLVLLLAVLVACGPSAPEGEESNAAEDTPMEAATVDDVEGEEEALEVPPEGALSLPEILAKLEALGYTEIIESEFEGGVWEVEYVVDGEERTIHVDPMTGEILPEDVRALPEEQQ